MSVSSSSEYGCDLYNNYRTYTPIQPLYPGLGHPVIYYAQVQKKQKPQQSEKVKNNYFVKAFRWYTEEHVTPKKIDPDTHNEDVQGFAAWLDTKYDEYMRKNQSQIVSSQYLLKQTSTVRNNKLPQSIVYETSGARKNKTKSPWRRRQKYRKQNGDTIKKSNQSIEIILNPKSLSQSASETCQKCCSNNAIIKDGNTPKMFKSKSESIIYILKEEELYVVPSEDKHTTFNKKDCSDDKNIHNGQINKRSIKDISCQCSILKLGKVDASSQFTHNKKNNVICDCDESYINIANARNNCFNTCCPCIQSQSATSQRVLKDEPNQSSIRPIVGQKSVPNTHSATVPRETSLLVNKSIGKDGNSFSVNGIAQTSDHAINPFNVINPERPIFFKIICVDKQNCAFN